MSPADKTPLGRRLLGAAVLLLVCRSAAGGRARGVGASGAAGTGAARVPEPDPTRVAGTTYVGPLPCTDASCPATANNTDFHVRDVSIGPGGDGYYCEFPTVLRPSCRCGLCGS